MKYLLDTNVLSDIVRDVPFVKPHFSSINPGLCRISTVTIKEIEYGRRLHPERAARFNATIDGLLKNIKRLPFDVQDAYATGAVRALLARRGTPIGPFDSLIAGTALARGLILVTANTKEFARVPHLRIENWRIPPREVREERVAYWIPKIAPC